MSLATGLAEYITEHKISFLAIDGRCGSGKTTLAAELSGLIPSRVMHTDDFYLPFSHRQENWKSLPAGNMDLDRIISDVLEPCRTGTLRSYRPYLCPKDCFGPERVLREDAVLNILEGSYSAHPRLRGYYDFSVFLTCSQELQTERLKRRENGNYVNFKNIWIPMEENYFTAFSIPAACDCIADAETQYIIFQTEEN